MEINIETIRNLITDTFLPLSQRLDDVESKLYHMTISNKTTIHYTDDERSSEETEEEQINLIDFGPEIDELTKKLETLEAEMKAKMEEIEKNKNDNITEKFGHYEKEFNKITETISTALVEMNNGVKDCIKAEKRDFSHAN